MWFTTISEIGWGGGGFGGRGGLRTRRVSLIFFVFHLFLLRLITRCHINDPLEPRVRRGIHTPFSFFNKLLCFVLFLFLFLFFIREENQKKKPRRWNKDEDWRKRVRGGGWGKKKGKKKKKEDVIGTNSGAGYTPSGPVVRNSGRSGPPARSFHRVHPGSLFLFFVFVSFVSFFFFFHFVVLLLLLLFFVVASSASSSSSSLLLTPHPPSSPPFHRSFILFFQPRASWHNRKLCTWYFSLRFAYSPPPQKKKTFCITPPTFIFFSFERFGCRVNFFTMQGTGWIISFD